MECKYICIYKTFFSGDTVAIFDSLVLNALNGAVMDARTLNQPTEI